MVFILPRMMYISEFFRENLLETARTNCLSEKTNRTVQDRAGTGEAVINGIPTSSEFFTALQLVLRYEVIKSKLHCDIQTKCF